MVGGLVGGSKIGEKRGGGGRGVVVRKARGRGGRDVLSLATFLAGVEM